jgi:lipopolysaccharide/colanic/teichoic acid biosynthesis glycosyltransferase
VAQAVVLPETSVCDSDTVRHCVSPSAGAASSAACDSAILAFSAEDPVIGSRALALNQGDGQSLVQGKLPHFVAKRALDIAASALALIVLAPLLLAVAAMIKIDSRGPVFFSHRRERKGGKEFPCVKFRTMVADAHQKQRELYRANEVDGPQFKMRDDPRVTRVGRWLRAVNIDELPQLINVLVGHMSLVGPRPSPFRENQICVPWRRARLSVRPGITGLWQICRDDCRQSDFHQWIYYDVAYVRNFSFWLDLKILTATVLTLGGRWNVPLSWLMPAARQSSTYTRRAVA